MSWEMGYTIWFPGAEVLLHSFEMTILVRAKLRHGLLNYCRAFRVRLASLPIMIRAWGAKRPSRGSAKGSCSRGRGDWSVGFSETEGTMYGGWVWCVAIVFGCSGWRRSNPFNLCLIPRWLPSVLPMTTMITVPRATATMILSVTPHAQVFRAMIRSKNQKSLSGLILFLTSE